MSMRDQERIHGFCRRNVGRYAVLDYVTKARSGPIPKENITSMICTFVGLLGTKKENLRILNLGTGLEMTYEEFLKSSIMTRCKRAR